ncbi:MAG: hypothetical protein JWQ78_1297 [Sediminibacterium sp.]|nr:hypothetical protein [Sediminibacterium sp.]
MLFRIYNNRSDDLYYLIGLFDQFMHFGFWNLDCKVSPLHSLQKFQIHYPFLNFEFLLPKPAHESHLHNAPIQNSVSAPHQGSAHAIRTHP